FVSVFANGRGVSQRATAREAVVRWACNVHRFPLTRRLDILMKAEQLEVKLMRRLTLICGALVVAAALATPARAQVNDSQTPNQTDLRQQTPSDNKTDSDGTKRGEDQTGGADLGSIVINPGTKDTVITFSAPGQLPNVTLPAGIYLFHT